MTKWEIENFTIISAVYRLVIAHLLAREGEGEGGDGDLKLEVPCFIFSNGDKNWKLLLNVICRALISSAEMKFKGVIRTFTAQAVISV